MVGRTVGGGGGGGHPWRQAQPGRSGGQRAGPRRVQLVREGGTRRVQQVWEEARRAGTAGVGERRGTLPTRIATGFPPNVLKYSALSANDLRGDTQERPQ